MPLIVKLWAHRWFLLVAAALIAGGGWEAARAILGPAVVVDRVQRGDLVETVVSTGNVQTPYRVNIGSQITGTVKEVLVEEGQRVTRDQRLIAIEDSELRAAVVQAQGALDQAEARIRQLAELTLPSARQSLAQAKAALLDAGQTFARTSELERKGFATRAALDDAQRDLDVARTQERTAELQVYTNSPGGSDYVMAQSALAQARASLDTAKSRLGYASIAAPRDGVLITRNVERGNVVDPSKVLLVLAPDGETQLQLAIDERNLGKLALGQHAVASADAYPDRQFGAVVSYINPGVDITRATVEVKLSVPNPPAYLVQDMTVSVDIETGRRNGTLVLAERSVHDVLLGTPWVMGIRNGRAYKQPVRIGLHGNTQVEILEGMAEGDLAVPANSGVLTGQPVRAIMP